MSKPWRQLTVLMPAFGSAGDVNPFIGLAQALKARGHRPRIIVNSYFQPSVEAAGVECLPFGDAARYHEVAGDPRIWDPRKGFAFIMQTIGIPAMRTLYDLIAAQPRKDTLLVASYLAFGARLAQEKLGLPMATAHLQPSVLPSLEDTPALPGLPGISRLPRLLRRWLLDYAYLRVVDPVVLDPLNALRAELGLAPVRDVLRAWVHSPELCVCLFPEWYARPQKDWPESCVTTDFVWQDGGGEPDPGLLEFMESGPAPLVFTAGSAMQHARAFFEQAAQAAHMLGMRAVLVARAGEQVPESLPPGVLHAPYAPFGWLFPRAALVTHHGGIGTTAQALRAGVPHLVTPFNFDQPDNARILKRLGVAEVLPPDRFLARPAAEAMRRLLTSGAVAENCARLARLCAQGPGVESAAQRIEALGLKRAAQS